MRVMGIWDGWARGAAGLAIGAVAALSGAEAAAEGADPVAGILAQRFPDAKTLIEADRDYDEKALFSGAFQKLYEPGETLDKEGRIAERVFEIPATRSTLEVYRAYDKSLREQGLEPQFECKNKECGGSIGYILNKRGLRNSGNWNDQRYGLYAAPDQGVFVGLYVSKKRVSAPERRTVWVGLEIVATDAEQDELETLSADEIAKAIAESGAAAIYGLEFETDSAKLLPGSRPVLTEMAKYLKAHPKAEILLVGHTDTVGALDYNMDLSKRRAGAVRAALAQDFGVAAGRLAAHGVGYLAPKASNAEEAGRARNRRVEMVRVR